MSIEGEDALSNSRTMSNHANGVSESNLELGEGKWDSEMKQPNGLETVPNSSIVETDGKGISSGMKKSSPLKKLPVKSTISVLPANEKPHSHKVGLMAVKTCKDAKVAANAGSQASSAPDAHSKCSSCQFSTADKKRSSNGVEVTEDDAVDGEIHTISKPAPAVSEFEKLGKSNSTSSDPEALHFEGFKEQTKFKPLRKEWPLKAEEDALSCSSPTIGSSKPLRIGSTPTYSFNFRCNERAEKRREFYSKLEEKNNAKEAERNSFQAKCKETQEAELKLLRKNITFKATPMPSFYQEPTPPKVELKKIPTTRARSPKLGRHKNSSVTGEGQENTPISLRVGRLSLDETKRANGSSRTGKDHKKPQRRSLPKLPSQKLKDFKRDDSSANVSSNGDMTTTVEVGKDETKTVEPAAETQSDIWQAEESEPDPEISHKAVVSGQC